MMVETRSLNGQWSLLKNGRGAKIQANVPGDVYLDLLNAGEIPDPFYRDNELDLQWIGETNWLYSRTFNVSEELLSRNRTLLRCDGLDTFAKITINDSIIGQTDNMFRSYEWDVRSALKLGKNTIRVEFASPLPYIEAHQKSFPGYAPMPPQAAYAAWVRKEQCNFGWDWGIKAVTCGIWKDIKLISFDQARLSDIRITQDHKRKRVELKVDSGVEGHCEGFKVNVSVSQAGTTVSTASSIVVRQHASMNATVSDPKLWWPNTMGEQPLYDVTVMLQDKDDRTIDSTTKRIGLRTIELDRHDDQWGESFQFVVNGVPLFAKGANWIPVDAILAHRTSDDYYRLVGDAAECNMNMLRVWGGGIYEDDSFYDACDKHGILVWQDFMFACAAYPTFQKGFMSNVRDEARDAIKRLRHHPSLALWCGNNELEMMNIGDGGRKNGKMTWKQYGALFDELLPQQVKELSPETPYWPSSPHSPKGDRSKHRDHHSGDAHLWIMSGRYPLDCARGMEHRFASEFGFQSFPEPKTVQTFAEKDDFNISSRIMEHHQRAPGGNITLMQQMLKCFQMPTDFDSTLWLSQILQGAGVKGVCEHFRRSMPCAMGALYWQLNDCWPVASWASIDYFGRWKALQYMSRHFFAPVLVSGVEDREKGTVDIHLTSDRLKRLGATVSWSITDSEGSILDSGSKQTKTPANASKVVNTLNLKKLLSSHKAHSLLVWLEADVEGEPPLRNLVLLAPPKHVELNRNPNIRYKVTRNGDFSFTIQLGASKVALWTWIELDGLDAKLSDNFFHLQPGKQEHVLIQTGQKITVNQLKSSLIVKSLVDTY